MSNFGEFLYTLRKERGMTQAELAEALGVTNKAVSKWETGEAMPETALLLPISRIFGVTVDELLDGKRAEPYYTESDFDTSNRDENAGDKKDKRFDEENIDEFFTRQFMEKHLFTRGKDEFPKNVVDRISGAVCALLFLSGLIAYLLIGTLRGLWHPYWVIIPACALGCGIVGSVFDLLNKPKREYKISKGENPYVGAICGIVMLACIISYLLLGAIGNLWHPYWIIVVCGAVFSAAVGAVGEIFTSRREK